MKNKLYLIILLLGFTTQSFSQTLFSIVEAPTYQLNCTNSCTTLHLNHPNTKLTNTYTVNSIPYHTVPITGTQIVFTADDYFSTAIPIGFSFCFFGNTYTQVYVSDNGHVTFNSTFNGVPSSFATQNPLPGFVPNSYPDNAIFGPFLDVKLSLGGNVKYATVGTAPFRKFVVQYNAVPFFNNACTNTTPSNFQIVLYETYNKIECNITNKEVCNTVTTNYLNYATLGIQNIAATTYFIVPGRNASIWTAHNESWTFDPAGLPDFTTKWIDAISGAIIGTNADSILICSNYFPYKVAASYTKICPILNAVDTVTLLKVSPKIDSIHLQKPSCMNATNGCITIYASGANPPFTYAVNNLPFTNTNTFCNIATGYLAIHVKDANGCVKDSTLTVPSLSQLMIVTDSIKADSCPMNNGAIWVHGTMGSAPYSYLWSNGDSDSVLNNVQGNANYTITVTDALGCTVSTIDFVGKKGIPLVAVSVIEPNCGDSSGKITLTVSGINNSPNYTYLWSTGDTTNNIDSLHSGFYAVTVTNANGCAAIRNIFLPDTLSISTPSPIATNTTCGFSNGVIYTNPSGGIPPYTYTIGTTIYTSAPSNLAAGTYTVITKDNTSCSTSDTLSVLGSDSLKIKTLVSNAHCDSINGEIHLINLNGPGLQYYLWSTGQTSTFLNGLAPATYWIKATDSLGCIASDTVQIGNDGSPHLTILTYLPPTCYGDSTGSISLTGQLGLSPYKYSLDSTNFSAQAIINNISGGTYTIYIRDANSCVRDTVVTFTQPDSILISTTKIDTLVCFDDKLPSITLSANGGFSPYLYQLNGNGFSATTSFNNLASGIQIIQVQDAKNCIKTLLINVPGPTEPLAVIITHSDLPCFTNLSGSIDAIISGGWQPYTTIWNNGKTSLQLDSIAPGNYVIRIIDEQGCKIQDSVNIVQKQCCLVTAPSAFSPNNDGYNDNYFLLPISNVDYINFTIVDRYGTVMFHTTNINDKWNGKFNNQDCAMGTYYFYLAYKCPFINDKIILKGDITLVR